MHVCVCPFNTGLGFVSIFLRIVVGGGFIFLKMVVCLYVHLWQWLGVCVCVQFLTIVACASIFLTRVGCMHVCVRPFDNELVCMYFCVSIHSTLDGYVCACVHSFYDEFVCLCVRPFDDRFVCICLLVTLYLHTCVFQWICPCFSAFLFLNESVFLCICSCFSLIHCLYKYNCMMLL